MKSIFSFLTIILFTAYNIHAQVQLDSLSYMDLNAMHGCDLNDIWGYTDENGNEYALVGTSDGVSVVDVTDPSNPMEVFWTPGLNSIWRDIKVFGDYAYVTTEASMGLMIIDLSPLPASTSLSTTIYSGEPGAEWYSAHNLYIDENGYAYIFGSGRGNGGVIILDVFTDPMNPSEVGEYDVYYVHDGYVRGDTMYLAHVYDGFFGVVDVSDKAAPVALAQHSSPNTFTHNVWLSGDGDYLFTTDEVSAGHIGSYDISDLSNISEADRIQSSPGLGIIPHNVHVNGQYIITSYYSDGVVVHDATYPYNLIEVGNYDTYPGQTTGYDGCWGVYPFFSSGTIVASDMTEGLFILGSNYGQAAYLEGTVVNSLSLAPLNQVNVSVQGNSWIENTDGLGFYATGNSVAGTYDVTYSKVGYYPQTISVSLITGSITVQDVQLVPIDQYALDVVVLNAQTSAPVDGAEIELKGSLTSDVGLTNALGQETFSLFYEEIYEVTAGKWGYVTACMDTNITSSTVTLTLYVDPGYYDDFTFDFGWSTTSDANTGAWVREVPFLSGTAYTPQGDQTGDCSDKCYLTGNAATFTPDNDDVDDGTVVLRSPNMDLTTYTEPYVLYDYFFVDKFGGPIKDDTLFIEISNGTDQVLLEKMGSDLTLNGQWISSSLRVEDFISITNAMQIVFTTSDMQGNPQIVEAAVDKFRVIESTQLNINELKNQIVVYPNPTSSSLSIMGYSSGSNYELISSIGRVIQKGELSNNVLDVSTVPSGIYLLLIDGCAKRVEILH